MVALNAISDPFSLSSLSVIRPSTLVLVNAELSVFRIASLNVIVILEKSDRYPGHLLAAVKTRFLGYYDIVNKLSCRKISLEPTIDT